MSLLQLGNYVAASGKTLKWKIECDALTDDDWRCLAAMARDIVKPFSSVWGVPRGGVRFAQFLREHVTLGAENVLLVDDVLTTGGSIVNFIQGCHYSPDEILVAFDRSGTAKIPFYYSSIFQLDKRL